MRHLLITQRRIPLDRMADYARLWHELRQQVVHAGGRAWLFRASSAGHRFTEFVEWESDDAYSFTGRAEIAGALEALGIAFPSRDSETWIEAKI